MLCAIHPDRWNVPALVICAATMCPVYAGQAAEPAPVAEPEAVSLPALPEVRLATIDDTPDEGTYARNMSARAHELAEQAKAAAAPEQQAMLRLSAVNLILAHEIEPDCSRRFYGLPSGTPVEDTAAALDRADVMLKDVGAQLTSMEGDDPAPEWLASARDRHSVLSGFAVGLREYLLPADPSDAARGARQAASALAVLLEDGREPVAAAAALWHAALRARERGDFDTLSLLPLPLSQPKRPSLPYGFFSRMLRCRLVAERGGHATALALLTQMEERIDEWFGAEVERNDARRALAWLQLEALRAWHGVLSDGRDSEARDWVARRAETLTRERFAEGPAALMRISPAIPLIALPSAPPPPQTPDEEALEEDAPGENAP